MSNTPIFERDINDLFGSHGEEINAFVEGVNSRPDGFLAKTIVRLIEIATLQNPKFRLAAMFGLNVEAMLNVAAIGVLLGIYAERQGWTIDTRDLDLSAFED